MPYASADELPPSFKGYSATCKRAAMHAFNGAKGPEARRFKIAHGAAKRCEGASTREADPLDAAAPATVTSRGDASTAGGAPPDGADRPGRDSAANLSEDRSGMPPQGSPVREAATKDGLPRKAFAYAPATDPGTWKLPFAHADGTPDPDLLPKAAAAMSEGGHRGQKADIPAANVAAVKSKLRAAYRRWKGSDAEYPDGIKEAQLREASAEYADGVVVREATVLLDRGPTPASVVFMPNGDAVVVPAYSGDFYYAAQPWPAPNNPADDWDAVFNAQDAHDMIGKLLALKNREQNEDAQVAVLDAAIAALEKYAKAEGAEIGDGAVAEAHGLGIVAALEEAGRRNSSKDQAAIQTAHDATVKLGAVCAGMAESAAVDVVESAAPAEVLFAEAAAAGAGNLRVASFAEAGAVFDDATRTVTITPIRPGFGNEKDGFYYPPDAVREAVEGGLFKGLKMFADHPRKSDDKELPERSVKDWVATLKEATWDEARQIPRVQLKVHKADVWEQWKDAPDQVAFSVLGGGMARPGRVNGREARIVESFKRLRSVDWVTEAGAGGAIDFAESAAAEEFDMTDIENLTPDQIKSGYPTLWGQLKEVALAEGAEGQAAPAATGTPAPAPAAGASPAEAAKAEGEAKTDAKTDAAATPAAEADAGKAASGGTEAGEAAKAGAAAPEVNASTEGGATTEPPAASAEGQAAAETKESAKPEDLAQRVQLLEARLERPDRMALGKTAVEAVLAESTLAKGPKDVIRARFAEAGWGNGFTYTDEPTLKTAVQGELAMAAQLLGHKEPKSKVTGLGAAGEAAGDAGEVRESALKELQEAWGEENIPVATDAAADGKEGAEAPASKLSESAQAAEKELETRFAG